MLQHPSRRLLLGHAVQRPQAPDQITAVNAHYLAVRKELGKHIECLAVVGIIKGRHQHQFVGDIEVGVACG